jgi:hypothetical protein
MRIIITVALLIAISIGASAQRIVPIGGSRTTDTGLIVGSLKVDSVLILPNYRTTNTNMVLGFDSRGKAVLRINNDSLIYATRRYVDSGFNAISAGSVDSSIYSTVTRLADSLRDLRGYVDSNNTIIYGNIATLQSDVVVLDSAVGVAFGAIAALYDTLPNYVDTAMLNDSLQAIKAAYVPYVGATTDVNIGTHNLLTNSVRLSTSPTGTLTNVGQLYFDATNVTPSIPLNANVTLQIGQEEHIRARNNTGVQINDGQVVYINSAQGNNPTIALANSDSVNTSEVIGVATENIADNGTGFVTTYGTVNGINTSAFNVGDILYLSATNGTITNVVPTPPHNVVKIGVALNDIPNGRIFVKPSQAIGQDTTFAAPYNSNKVAPTQRAIGTYVRNITKDTASALRGAINTKLNSSDTASLSNRINLKYGTSDTGRAATNIVTGGSLNKVRDSLNTLIAAKGSGTVTSIQLVGGTNVTITPTTAITTSGVYTISATGGSSTIVKANEFNMLYKANGDTTIRGTTKVRVDTTDLRMEFAYDSTTTSVTTDPHGGIKMWGSNRMGMGAVRINDTVSIPASLQRAINAQITSTILPGEGIRFTNNFIYGGMVQTSGTVSPIAFASYSSTSTQSCYNRITYLASAAANQSAGLRIGNAALSAGIICGNTKFGGGGGRGTIIFSLPVYNSGQRIYAAYTTSLSMLLIDPGALSAAAFLAVGKDAGDAFMSFYHNDNSGSAIKVPLPVTPNSDDVYRFTVYIAPNSTYYMQLEVISKTGISVYTLNPTSDIPPINTRLQMQTCVNSASTGVGVQLGIIQITEEIY